MKKCIKVKMMFLLLCLNIVSSFADDAPMAKLPGGNVKPINNNDVQLLSETIDITLFSDYYAVEVNYQFLNQGKEQTVMMGFPSLKEGKVMDLRIESKGEKLQTQTKPGSWNFNLESKYIHADPTAIMKLDAFECFEVNFKAGETISLKDSYKQNYTNERHGRESFYYILKTGSLWKDKINSIEIRVHPEKAPSDFNLANGYFNDTKCSMVKFVQKYSNIEPASDLFFAIDRYKDFDVTKASSVLNPSGKINYNASNVKDNNKSTAWVEGVSGYGIGEKISFKTNLSYNYGDVLELDSIGIINGYAKSLITFNENSRVKKLIIKTSTESAYDEDAENKPLPVVYTFALKDTPEIQYLKFKTPINVTDIEMAIADIYKGSKYMDTAITDIVFFVNQYK
jgi:hypothetical protein